MSASSLRVSRDQIRDVADRVNIVEVVGGYVTLRKAGVNWLGLCPFHGERTPSFNVSETRQTFHCFGCGEGGDVFKFLMKIEGLNFFDALRNVAERAGVSLPEKENTPDEKRRLDDRERLLQANEAAAAWFQSNLLSGGKGASYLEGRGVTEEARRAFGLGHAPEGWDHLARHLESVGIPAPVAEQAGLLIPRQREGAGRAGHYDRFRDRLMVPIANVSGRILAFGGRALGDDPAKYINSPESLVYAKSEVLYGLHQARPHIQKSDLCLVVEGYFDVISLAEAGVRNVVATCGTALTSRHVEALKRYTRNVTLLFDSDLAGQKAAIRSLEVFLEGGVWPSYLSVPDGKDPDEFVRTFGSDAFRELLPHSRPLVERFLESCLERHQGHPLSSQKVLDEAAPLLARLKPVAAQPWWSWLSDRLRVDERLVVDHLRRVAPRFSPPSLRSENQGERSVSGEDLPLTAEDRLLVQLLAHHPEPLLQMVEEHVLDGQVRSEAMRGLLALALEDRRVGRPPDPRGWMEGVSSPGLRRCIAEDLVRSDPFPGEKELQTALRTAFVRIRRAWLEAQRAEVARTLRHIEEEQTSQPGMEGRARLVELAQAHHRIVAEMKALN